MWVKSLTVIAVCHAVLAQELWKVSTAERTVDISSQIIKVSTDATFENVAKDDSNSLLVAIPADEDGRLSFIAVREQGNKGKLKTSKQNGVKNGFQLYKVEFLKQIPSGSSIKLRIEYAVTQALSPYPAKITQQESQYILYQGSAFFASAYEVGTEKSTFKLASGGKTLSATSVTPSKQESERVVYGPYTNQPAFGSAPIKIHYENNSPFVVAAVVERTLEVSHWGGNIAVEEYIELVHKGAELKGTFSRLDYQMDRRGFRQPALIKFSTSLPATANSIYYRDEIGNISTSDVRVRADSVEVAITPRFPLFGGWRTSYVLGYNVPAHEYLSRRGNDYSLKMKVFDHIFDNIVVEKLVTKVVLPELVRKIKINTPYPMDRRPDEIRPSYLDTFGRTVVVLEKKNLVSEHIQTFTVSYEFDATNMIREPLLATAFFLAIFTFVIIYVRLDFSLVADPKEEAKERIRSKIGSLDKIISKKQMLYSNLTDAVANFKSSRDTNVLWNAKVELESSRADLQDKLSALLNTLRIDSSTAFDKGQDLLRYDKAVFDAVDGYIGAVQASEKKNGPEDNAFAAKIAEARTRADSILASL